MKSNETFESVVDILRDSEDFPCVPGGSQWLNQLGNPRNKWLPYLVETGLLKFWSMYQQVEMMIPGRKNHKGSMQVRQEYWEDHQENLAVFRDELEALCFNDPTSHRWINAVKSTSHR